MKYDVASDLHTDLWTGSAKHFDLSGRKNLDSPVLVIGGDTSNYLEEIPIVLKKASGLYEHVVFTDGNHEGYFHTGDVDSIEAHLMQVAKEFPNVTYLNGTTSYRCGDTVFIGANGWYDFKAGGDRWSVAQEKDAWHKMSNDSRRINFGSTPPEIRAEIHANLLMKQVTDLQGENIEIVIVTHTIPNIKLEQWSEHRDTPDAILNGAYYNVGMEIVRIADRNGLIKIWNFGHTHQRSDRFVDGIRYVNNSRGYEVDTRSTGKWFLAQIDTEDQAYG